ncbi:MAG: type IA DNA topoisomerase [Lachnospiraceae bacterium]|nr:type IA DNA topoisomerase [Lachnospiraceae bacterium]
MSKSLYIAEKPSVAQEFAKALKINGKRNDGYIESSDSVVTWCVGHLVTMSYPEAYDPALKRWSLDTLPFLPEEFKYEVIDAVKKQFKIVSGLLNRSDISTIYVCTDSGREGEYIYRLVEQMAGVKGKERKRVWIDSQTEEEILKGISNAKDLSAYDNLSASAYLRAKEDYLMGINFSRLMTLKYGSPISSCMNTDKTVVSIGRVMTCVLGMVVRREREIRDFVKTAFYKVVADIDCDGHSVEAEWKAVEGSRHFNKPYLYKDNGFLNRADAENMIEYLKNPPPVTAKLLAIDKKKEKKNPPLLYNLAELQNDCSKTFKISPDEVLNIVQELYEKKLVTYPRTDARVLSTAVAKEIHKNISGLRSIPGVKAYAEYILENGLHKNIAKTKYTNDKLITDHYAIIPTGQGINALKNMPSLNVKVYEKIVRRFLSIFFPAAVYQKTGLEFLIKEEHFFASFKVLIEEGYLAVAGYKKTSTADNKPAESSKASSGDKDSASKSSGDSNDSEEDKLMDKDFLEVIQGLKKNDEFNVNDIVIKEGETSPPKRYSSGSMILAMENAGQLIEDEELRAQIKGSGIGTSATRAEILKKLFNIKYLSLNKKTQIITPTLLGEMIYDVVNHSMKQMLNPELTASWEKGLTYVANGEISEGEYMDKLEAFISNRVNAVRKIDNNQSAVRYFYNNVRQYYKK